MGKISKYLKNPRLVYLFASTIGLTDWIPDSLHIKLLWKTMLPGEELNLEDPKTFNEKIQWLKLHDRNNAYVSYVDKLKAKELISERFGSKYINETLGIWKTAEDIDFSTLPEKFVLKTNHDSGGVVVCSNRDNFDEERAKKILSTHLRKNYYFSSREWPYKDVVPVVFAEQYIEPQKGQRDLADYKLYCFGNGRVITLVCEGRNSEQGMCKTYFDEEWNLLDIAEGGHSRNAGCSRPPHFEEMLAISRTISEGKSFVRVDFFEGNDAPLFGEITLYPNSGFGKFEPKIWNQIFGDWVPLDGIYGEK